MTDIKYLAVADPTDESVMTFWRFGKHGQLAQWPRQATYGPTLWNAPGAGREHIVPAELKGEARRVWIQNWHRTVRAEWMTSVRAVVDADPIAAGARFAALNTCCARCGKALDDPASRARALGSDCVTRFPDEVVAALCREVGRAFTAQLAGDEEGALISKTAAFGDAARRESDAA